MKVVRVLLEEVGKNNIPRREGTFVDRFGRLRAIVGVAHADSGRGMAFLLLLAYVAVWVLFRALGYFVAPVLRAEGQWAWAYLIAPTESSLLGLVAAQQWQLLVFLGWPRKLLFKPLAYIVAGYVPLATGEQANAASTKRFAYKKRMLGALLSRPVMGKRVVRGLLLLFPNNVYAGLARVFELSFFETMSRLMFAAGFRVYLAWRFGDQVLSLLSPLAPIKSLFFWTIAVVMFLQGVMAIRSAWRRI